MLRILYFFTFKSNQSLVEIQPLNNSKIYTILNNLYNYLFVFVSFVNTTKQKSNLVNSSISNQNKSFLSTVFNVNSNIGLIQTFDKYYYYFDLSKLAFIGNSVSSFLLKSPRTNVLINYYNNFVNVIQWNSNLLLSYNKFNTFYSSLFYYENLSVETSLMFFLIEDNFLFSTHNTVKKSNNSYDNGLFTGFLFNQLSKSSFQHSDFYNDSVHYYTFLTFYKFYNVDIYRSSFLFFENVRHSTKLEIIWTIIPTLVLVLIAMHLLRYYILMMSL